jgi:hypothetical protein
VVYLVDKREGGDEFSLAKLSTRLEIVGADGKRRRRLDVLEGVRFDLGDWR